MAARFCAQCGNEVSSAAQFCPRCGKPVNGAAPDVSKVEAAANTTRRMLVPAMIAALVVLVIVVAILIGKAHQPVTAAAPEPPTASVLSAPTAPQPSAPLTNQPTTPQPAPPVTNAASKPAPTLPPDVAAYLAFLQKVDTQRVAIENDPSEAGAMQAVVGQMQASQTDPDQMDQQEDNIKQGFAKLNKGYNDYQTKWQLLIRDFRSVQPPLACVGLANQYYSALVSYADIISKTQTILDSIQLNNSGTPDYSAILKAQPVLQQAQTQVNLNLSQSDQQLGQLCDRYGVPKPFSIQVEGGSSPLTGM